MSSAASESGGDVTYDLVTIAAVNSSTSALDGETIIKLNFWIHAVLIKMLPCLLLTLFGCLLVSTVRASQRRAVKLHGGSRSETNLSKAGNRRLAERNRTTVRQLEASHSIECITDADHSIALKSFTVVSSRNETAMRNCLVARRHISNETAPHGCLVATLCTL